MYNVSVCVCMCVCLRMYVCTCVDISLLRDLLIVLKSKKCDYDYLCVGACNDTKPYEVPIHIGKYPLAVLVALQLL